MTIVWLPFLYEASVREPRWQKPKQVFLADRQPVEIETISDADAPIVATAHTTWRRHGETFVRPVLHPRDSAPVTPAMLAEMAEAGVIWNDYPMTPPNAENPFSNRRHYPSVKALTLSRSADPARAATSGHAGHIRLLDGAFWVECAEPVIAVEFEGGSTLGNLRVRIVDDWTEQASGVHFAMDDLAAATAYLATLSARLRRGAPAPPSISVVRADLLRFSARDLLTRQVLHRFREALPRIDTGARQRHPHLWERIIALSATKDPSDREILDAAIEVLDLATDTDGNDTSEELAVAQLRHVHLPILADLIREIVSDDNTNDDLAQYRVAL